MSNYEGLRSYECKQDGTHHYQLSSNMAIEKIIDQWI